MTQSGEWDRPVDPGQTAGPAADSLPDALGAILHGVADGVTVQDPSGRLVYANGSALRLLGYPTLQALLETPAELLLRRYEVLDERRLPLPLDALPGRLALHSGTEQEALVAYRTRETGEERWSRVRSRPVTDAAGAVELVVNVFHDVTEQRFAEEDQQFLARASAELASSLDSHATLRNVARAALPRLGDGCMVYLGGGDGRLQRIMAVRAGAHPGVSAGAGAWDRAAGSLPETSVLARLARSGEVQVLSPVPDALLDDGGADDAPAPPRIDGPHSAIVAPLNTRDRSLGAIVFIGTRADLRFGPRDVELARELAGRVASAVENARLYDAERRARERAGRLQDLTAALSMAATAREVARAVVTHATAALGAQGGMLTCLEEDGSHLELVHAVGHSPALVERWQRTPMAAAVPQTEAVRSRRPVVVASRADCLARFPELVPAQDSEGYTAVAAVPLLVDHRVLGALRLSFRETEGIDGDDEAFLLTVGRLCAQALERSRLFDLERRARSAARAAERRSAFLAEASRVLSSSLEYEATLRNVAQLAVPRLADWCAVDVLGAAGSIELVAVAHVDPSRAEWGRLMRRQQPVSLESPRGVGRVLRTGETEYVEEVTDSMLVAAAASAEHLAGLRQIGFRSYVCVPMVARGRTLGAITLVRTTESDELYTPADVALAEDLARRAATAVDNAQLYLGAVTANHAKANFLATMSHELRTPLTAVLGFAELLRDGIVGPVSPAQEEFLARIAASSTHLLAIIEEILSFAQLETGAESVRSESVQVGRIAREALAFVEPLLDRKGLDRVVEVEDDEPIHTDGTKVRQILLNLLVNAIKFTEHGEIRVRVRRDAAAVVVTVMDTGIGIAPEHLERVFESFWQVEQTTTRTVGGTGIGLSIARHLAQLLGGSLAVESAPGRGSAFSLRLPASA